MAELAAIGGALGGVSDILAPIATVAGTVVSYAGTMAAGKSAKAAAEYEAQQQEIAAKEERAAAQRDAEQLRRRKTLALSNLQTNAAASGFSASDPTVLNLAEDISRYGTVQEQMAQYGGESRAAGRRAQAEAARMSGRAAMQGAQYRAIGTVLSGITSLADRYNPSRRAGAGASSPYYYGSGAGATRVSGSSVYYG